MKKPKISAEVTQEEFEAYKAAAATAGVGLSEWIRSRLNERITLAPATEPAVTAPVPQLVVTKAAPPPVSPKTPEHPCVLLNPALPGVLTSGECSGTCNSSSQRGKPCFFGPATARKCPLFMNRVMPKPPVQDMRARK